MFFFCFPGHKKRGSAEFPATTTLPSFCALGQGSTPSSAVSHTHTICRSPSDTAVCDCWRSSKSFFVYLCSPVYSFFAQTSLRFGGFFGQFTCLANTHNDRNGSRLCCGTTVPQIESFPYYLKDAQYSLVSTHSSRFDGSRLLGVWGFGTTLWTILFDFVTSPIFILSSMSSLFSFATSPVLPRNWELFTLFYFAYTTARLSCPAFCLTTDASPAWTHSGEIQTDAKSYSPFLIKRFYEPC